MSGNRIEINDELHSSLPCELSAFNRGPNRGPQSRPRLRRSRRKIVMKAMVCEAFGGPEVLAWRDLPDPRPPGPGEIQVRIRARGVQYVDVLMLAGKYQFRPEPPF